MFTKNVQFESFQYFSFLLRDVVLERQATIRRYQEIPANNFTFSSFYNLLTRL